MELEYRPPLDFPAMLAFLAKRALPGIEHVGPDSYHRVVGTPATPGWLQITRPPGRDALCLHLAGVDAHASPDLVRRVRRVFNLDADLAAVHAVLAGTPLLAKAIRRRPGLRVPGGWDGFEVAVRAVLGQQVSVAGATTLARRLVERYGEPVPGGPAGLDRLFPAPARLLDAPLESLGLPRRRAATLRAVALAVAEGRLHFDPDQSLDDFVRSFTALPGIGPWTAHYVALRALGHADAFPAGDLVLQQVLGGDKRLSERETETRSQAWRPWRAHAVLQLWHLASDRD